MPENNNPFHCFDDWRELIYTEDSKWTERVGGIEEDG
jgi:hypothetical protein